MKTLFAIMGLTAAVIMTVGDFYTSYIGGKAVIASSKGIVGFMPLAIALFTLAFNATSAYIFITAKKVDFPEVSRMYLLGLWVFFLLFDAISSWVGFMLPIAEANSTGVWEAFTSLSTIQQLFAIVIPVLMVTGPFLATLFWEMCTEARERLSQMANLE